MNSLENQIILVSNLKKSYGEHIAVDQLSFGIEKGETLGLLGPNGAGKTTTISMLVGMFQPDEGEVIVGAKDGNRQGNPVDPAVRRLIGIAPQALSLYSDLTATENLEFFGQLYGLSGTALKQRVEWSLEFAQLEDRSKDRVKTFSGGMKRRLNIAVALIHEPEILLLDEPTVGVDPQSRNHIFECIETLRERGLTILYTTHYMEEAQRLCDRVAIIDHGKMLALDSIQGLLEKYGGCSMVSGELVESPAHVDLPGEINGTTIQFESEQPLEEVARLTQKGVQFLTLNVAQPSLESVFLTLTGRSLRD
ncbi:MAG: ABC transporter ATP-binding protein [Planctomycetota bacterium]